MCKTVVIIGAGPAGLTAGYELLKQGKGEYAVTILEESGEIGGISKTIRHYGNRMDIGGHRFFSKSEEVMQWWENMLPLQGAPAYDDKILRRKKKVRKNGPDPEKEDRVMLLRNRVSRIYYHRCFFDYPITLKWQTLKNMGFFTTVRAGGSYLLACAHKREENSLENFYINRFGKVLYSMFFEDYTQKLWGRHPREISADWGAQRVKGLSVKEVLRDMLSKNKAVQATVQKWQKKPVTHKKETSLIEEFYYPKYGPGQMWETVAEEFEKMGGIIIRNAKVTHIQRGKVTPDRILSVDYEQQGQPRNLTGDIFISSMPVKDLVEGMEGVPADIHRIAVGLPYRDFVTVGVLVKRLLLKNETKIKTLHDIVPDCWIYVQDTGVRLGRIQIFNNWSPYMVEDVEDKVWLGLEYFCDEKDRFFHLTEQQYIRYVGKELMKMHLIASQEDILDAHVEKVKKAYPAYFDTYAEMPALIRYLDSIDNLYCVGRNGQHRYNNMDHSMMTAFEAVKNIRHGIKDRRNIWNVNVEGEYHEAR